MNHFCSCWELLRTNINDYSSFKWTELNQMVIYLRFFIFTLRETFQCATKSVITYWLMIFVVCVRLCISRLNSIQFIINWLNYMWDLLVMSYGPLNRDKQTPNIKIDNSINRNRSFYFVRPVSDLNNSQKRAS